MSLTKRADDSRRRWVLRVLASAFACACTFGAASLARAQVETTVGTVEVVHGTGEVTINEDVQTTLTSEGKVIYAWEGIQQPSGHTLEFDQSGDDASALNYGKGQNPFEFFGTVKSNGTVIFANEAGVHFQDGSSVQVYNLIAAAGRISNEDFLTGKMGFDLTGDVTNSGTITGFQVALLGERVANHGDIYVEDGQLLMLAGDAVVIREHDSPIVMRVPFRDPGRGSSSDDVAVENTGVIDAGEYGHVRLAAADGLAYAIRNRVVARLADTAGGEPPASGLIRAGEIEIVGGEGSGVEIGGTLDATRSGKLAVGGDIGVFGSRIAIADDALIDASGSEGGGRVHIGAGKSGATSDETGGADAPRPDLVFVSKSAEIHADAEYAGDGGEVVVWSDGHAYVHGSISARGGEQAGKGGFVETSGRVFLDVTRPADVSARAGRIADQGGEWWIDPWDVIIDDFNFTPAQCEADPRCLDSSVDLDNLFFVNDPTLYTVAGPSLLDVDVVNDALTRGSSLIITTSSGTEEIGEDGGTILVRADITPGLGANEDTAVLLRMRAANHIIVEADIGANPDKVDVNEYENLNLAVQLVANDNGGQPEAPNVEGETPNQLKGDVVVKGDIRTNGSDLLLQGVGIEVREGTEIVTDGGDVLVAAIGAVDPETGNLAGGGDAILEGSIDTSNSEQDRAGEPLFGGTLTVQARSGLVGQVGGGPESASAQGGSVRIEGPVTLGQHDAETTALEIQALGGDIDIDAPVDTGGGSVDIFALRVSEDASLQTTAPEKGGRFTLSDAGSITTRGGDVRIEAKATFNFDQRTSRDGKTLLEIYGPIDTSPRDFAGDYTGDTDGDGLIDTVGGNVVLRAEGESESNPSGRVRIVDARGTGEDLIVTRGGYVEVNVDEPNLGVPSLLPDAALSSVFLSAGIDAGLAIGASPDIALENTPYGDVAIDSAAELVFENASTGAPFRVRGERVRLLSASRSPLTGGAPGDLEFVSNGSGVGPEIWAREIELRAGADSDLGFADTESRIVPGDVRFYDQDGGIDIETFTFAQNAPITGADVLDLSYFAGGASTLDDMTYVLESMTGSVILDDATKVTGTGVGDDLGAKLVLIGEDDVELGGTVSDWTAAGLQLLRLTIRQGFSVDTTLAENASAATDVLTIETGDRSIDPADLRIEDGVELVAAKRLDLHAAVGGSAGDLVFGTEEGGNGAPITLRSSDLRLWAGIGQGAKIGASETNRVVAGPDSPTDVAFELLAPDTGFPRFELRQEAAIGDGDLPDIDQFIGSGVDEIGLVDYSLRSDSADITLGYDGGQKLARTNLSLLARDGVNVDMGEDGVGAPRKLQVRTLDVGGTAAFEVTQQLIDQFEFAQPAADTGAAPNAITLRAGVAELAELGFDTDDTTGVSAPVTIRGDEIRLVAGDGTGATGADGPPQSFIRMNDQVRFEPWTGSQIQSFVFDQDADVTVSIGSDGVSSPLPDIGTNFEGVAPATYAVQSSDGEIRIVLGDFVPQDGGPLDPRLLLPLATETTILSAQVVSILRQDGEDLDLARVFSTDPANPVPSLATRLLEIRAFEALLETTDGALTEIDDATGQPVPLPEDPNDLVVIDVGNAFAGKGLYLYGFAGEEISRLEAPVRDPLDISIQDGINDSIVDLFAIRQDGTITSQGLLDLDRSGSGCGFGRGAGCDPEQQLRTQYLLTSVHGDIRIRPDRVLGSDLVLEIPLAAQDDPIKSSRTIQFDPDPTAVGDPLLFFNESFRASSAFGWIIDPNVTLQGAVAISLQSGTSGRGDLGFGPGVTLQSEFIQLGAFGSAERSAAYVHLPIVDARTNSPTFDFLQPDVARDIYSTRQDSDRDRFTIWQDGYVNDLHADRPSIGDPRTLPDPATQFVNCGQAGACGGLGHQLFGYTIQSNRRGIRIEDLTDVEATRLLLLANFDEKYDADPETVDRPGEIIIDHTNATNPEIDFEAVGIDRAALVGDSITLIGGPDAIVDASGDFFFAGNSGPDAPPLAFTIEQDVSFIDNPADETGGLGVENLPAFFQFSGGLTGVEYTLRLRDGGTDPNPKIQIGSGSASKLRGTRLVLEALDTVEIDVPEDLLEGIVLTDLVVRESNSDDTKGVLDIFIGSVFDPTDVTDPDLVATLIESIENQLYDGTVHIIGNVEFIGEDMTFNGDVLNETIGAGEYSGMDFLTRGTVSFAGNVGCNSTNAASCIVEGAQWQRDVNGVSAYDGIADTWLDRFRVRFDADDPAPDALGFEGDGDQSVFALNVDILAISPQLDFDTLDVEIEQIPPVSSIYKRDGDYDPSAPGPTTPDTLSFYTRDAFNVAAGQKIAVQGNFAAHSEKLVAIGDTSALQIKLEVDPNLVVPGDDTTGVVIQKRPGAPYYAPDGRLLNDAGIGFVTNLFDSNVPVQLVGSGTNPSLAVPDPSTVTDPTLAAFTLTTIDAAGDDLDLSDFEWQIADAPRALPALHAFGLPRNDITQAVVVDEPTPPPFPWMASEWLVDDARRLRELSVRMRDRTVAEWQRFLEGAGLIDDIGSNTPRRDGLETVAQPRLLAQDAQRTIELYQQLFGEDGVNAPRVRAVLTDALDRYRRSSGTRNVVGFEFRRYVKNRPNSLFDAYQIIEDLDALFDRHRALGLTPGEYRPIQYEWLAQIQPEGITIQELSEAVHPSRYVRGTDILEIFGD